MGEVNPYQGNLVSLTKGVNILETAMGANCSLDQVLLSKNFRPRPGSRQKFLLRKSGVVDGGQNLILKLGEEHAGSEEVGLGSQSSVEPLGGFCVRVLHQVLCYAHPSAEPSCRTPKVRQNSGGMGGAQTHLLRTGFFSSHNASQLFILLT